MTIFLHENLKIAYIEVQETNGKFLLKKKKNSVKFRTRMPQGLTVWEFWSERKGGVFLLKLSDIINKGRRRKRKIILKKKNNNKKLVSISYNNAPRFDRSTILTRM